jgi:hypothetical protein
MYLGADPELMVLKDQTVVPASSVDIPDGKWDIMSRISLQGGKMSLYRDGYSAELNLAQPQICRADMGHLLADGLREFLKMPKYQGLNFSTIPAVPVTQEEIYTLPPDAAQFGCSPSRNAWKGGAEGLLDVEGLYHLWRYAGGHLWFSDLVGRQWWTVHLQESIKLLDLYVGIPFSYLFSSPAQYQRRILYGRAGEYREKKFLGDTYQGLEYRTLGPEWMNNACFFSLALGSARYVLQHAQQLWEQNKDILDNDLVEGQVIQNAINTGKDLPAIIESFELEPYYSKGTIQKLRNESEVGEKRFIFNFLAEQDFHKGWFSTLNQLSIKSITFDDDNVSFV